MVYGALTAVLAGSQAVAVQPLRIRRQNTVLLASCSEGYAGFILAVTGEYRLRRAVRAEP